MNYTESRIITDFNKGKIDAKKAAKLLRRVALKKGKAKQGVK